MYWVIRPCPQHGRRQRATSDGPTRCSSSGAIQRRASRPVCFRVARERAPATCRRCHVARKQRRRAPYGRQIWHGVRPYWRRPIRALAALSCSIPFDHTARQDGWRAKQYGARYVVVPAGRLTQKERVSRCSFEPATRHLVRARPPAKHAMHSRGRPTSQATLNGWRISKQNFI